MIRLSSQPQGRAYIDYGNSITKDIVAAYLPNSINSGLGQRELISNIADSSNVNYRNPRLRPSSRGLTWSTEHGSVPSLNFTLTGKPTGTTPMTVFCLFEQLNTNSVGIIWKGGSDSTYGMYFLKNNDGTVVMVPDSNSLGGFATPALSTYKPYAICGIQNRATSFRECFLDGASLGSLSNTGPNGSGFGYFGSVFRGGDNRSIRVYCAMMWSRMLTPAEVKSLSDNPWQVFSVRRKVPNASYLPLSTNGNFFLMF